MDDPLILPTVSATRNRLADLMTSIGQGAGKAVDWLAGGAQVGAEPTLALMRGDALGEPFLPTADGGGRIGAIASALGSTVMPVHAPPGALGAGPVLRTADAALDMLPEARAARAAEQGFDPNRTLYHGTNAETPIEAFRPSEYGHFGPGVYLSEQPGVAGAYGNAIYPVHTRGEMFNARPGFATRLKGAEAQDLIDAMPARPAAEAWKDNRIAAQKHLDENGYIDRETMWNYLSGQVGRDNAQEILKARGYAGIEGIGDGAETVVFDPANIRSRFAAFDPARSGEADLLASRAGVPAVPQQPAPQPEDPAMAAARAAWIQQHLARGGM